MEGYCSIRQGGEWLVRGRGLNGVLQRVREEDLGLLGGEDG